MRTAHRPSTIEHRIGADGLLVVRIDDADIHLSGVDGDTASVTADDRDDIERLAVERGDRSLELSARSGMASADLSIEVPTGATVVIESRNGDISTERLTGDSRLTTGSGDVTIRGAGGSVAVEAVSGDVEIVAPDTLDVVARTVSGDLGLRAGDLRRAQLTTTSGDITVSGAFTGDGPFRIETVSGDSSIDARGAIRVEATTLTGDIRGPSLAGRETGDRGTIVVGTSGGPTLAFRSTSGDLYLRVLDDAVAPLPPAAPLRPAAPLPPAAPNPLAAPLPSAADDPNLEILRALERGDIDVQEAAERLTALESDERSDA